MADGTRAWDVNVGTGRGWDTREVGPWCMSLVKGVPTPRSGGWRRRRWRLHYRVHGKSRVYKLMHVKSLERNRPACIMERNAVRVRPAGLFQAPPCKRRRVRSMRERAQRSACDIINRYDVYGRRVNI